MATSPSVLTLFSQMILSSKKDKLSNKISCLERASVVSWELYPQQWVNIGCCLHILAKVSLLPERVPCWKLLSGLNLREESKPSLFIDIAPGSGVCRVSAHRRLIFSITFKRNVLRSELAPCFSHPYPMSPLMSLEVPSSVSALHNLKRIWQTRCSLLFSGCLFHWPRCLPLCRLQDFGVRE